MLSKAADGQFLYIPTPALVLSLCFHLAVPISLVWMSELQSWNLFGKKRISTMEIYQDFIQVDVVALPDELFGERTSIDATLPIIDKTELQAPPVTKEEKSDVMISPDVSVDKGDDAAKTERDKERQRRSEQERALKRLHEEAAREKALQALALARDTKRGRPKLGGNILSKGTAMSGMIGTAKDRYTALVTQAIREHFNVYPWQRKKKLVSVVHLEIYPTGKLKEKRLVRSSLDPIFDSAVMQAIEDTQPLPVPDDMSVVDNGITVEFRSE